jgi:hypothetical protein
MEMNVRKALIPMLVLVAALLAPAAHAAQRPDDRAGIRGPAPVLSADLSSSIRPDDRAGIRGPGGYESAQLTAVRPDDRAGMRGPAALPSDGLQPVSTGFDWGDAMIGGLGGIGTALMLTGLLFLVMTRRSRARLA